MEDTSSENKWKAAEKWVLDSDRDPAIPFDEKVLVVRRVQQAVLLWVADQLRPWDRDLSGQLVFSAELVRVGETPPTIGR